LDYDFPACVHLGILDFDLTDYPDYFHEYVIQHKEYHDIYTSKIRFFVLELKKLKNASRIERKSKRYRWAALIAATTWEDVQKFSKGDPYMERARDLIYDMSQDEEERYLYLRQQMAIIDENSRLRTARNDGLEEGLATGREEGRAEGRKEGLAAGRKEGLAAGRKEGLAAGRKEGLAAGRKAGNIEGRILARCRDVQDGDYTKKHAASKLGISLADFEQYYAEFLQTGKITI
jgi:flagellar biosynthesis/type III secretory pathway protein FliH